MRTSYIGGSDAASVIGVSPYRSNVELWEQKTGRRKAEDISAKSFVQYGIHAEDHLRELFKLDFPQYEVGYEENNIWINDKFPFGHCSLDGWLTEKDTGRKGILEIKTTTMLSAAQRAQWDGQVPPQYFAQVVHYLLITEWDFAIIKSQQKHEYDGDVMLVTKHYTIEREEVEDDIAYLEEAERKFCEYLKADKQPPLILPSI